MSPVRTTTFAQHSRIGHNGRVVADGAPALQARSRRLAMLAAGTCTMVVTLGWTTGLRDGMHASLIAVGVFALFPFLVIATLLGVLMLCAFACAWLTGMGGHVNLLDGFDEPAARGLSFLSKGVGIYYRWLARHRTSAWFGLPLGLLLGGLLLWAALGVIVIPREAQTMAHLRAAQLLIEDNYKRVGHYPPPGQRGSFVVPGSATAAFGNALSEGGQLLDAFGRPVDYLVKGHGRLASYRLRSSGFDGIRTDDDLCTQGETRLQRAVVLLAFVDLVSALSSKHRSWRSKLEDIDAASCGETHEETR